IDGGSQTLMDADNAMAASGRRAWPRHLLCKPLTETARGRYPSPYVYGLLHHPGYRERFADNLKREMPRISLAPDFRAFATAGRELAHLHLEYEKLEPYPLDWRETTGVPLSYRVDGKMRLSKDKATLVVNPTLTLAGIPPETFQYRLGNRSALEWVIDQYQVKQDKRSGIRSDPNRADDEEYIVRLVGQVVNVSLETARIVAGLPSEYSA